MAGEDKQSSSYEEQSAHDSAYQHDGDGYENYVETTVDPGYWLLLVTAVFCFGVMLIVLPCMVKYHLRRQANEDKQEDRKEALVKETRTENGSAVESKPTVEVSMKTIFRYDKETRKILRLAVPLTISSLASSVFSMIVFTLVSHRIGTKAIAALCVTEILLGLTDGVMYGPIYACTTLCAQAIGAGNQFLAGQYVQIATMMFLICYMPVVFLSLIHI